MICQNATNTRREQRSKYLLMGRSAKSGQISAALSGHRPCQDTRGPLEAAFLETLWPFLPNGAQNGLRSVYGRHWHRHRPGFPYFIPPDLDKQLQKRFE